MVEINTRRDIFFLKIEEKFLNRGYGKSAPWLYKRLNKIGMVPCFLRNRTRE